MVLHFMTWTSADLVRRFAAAKSPFKDPPRVFVDLLAKHLLGSFWIDLSEGDGGSCRQLNAAWLAVSYRIEQDWNGGFCRGAYLAQRYSSFDPKKPIIRFKKVYQGRDGFLSFSTDSTQGK
jgi:hypothetical protein